MLKYFYWISAAIFVLVLIIFVFAPAFAGKITIMPQISFGKFAIRLYGITLAGAILTGYFVARAYSWRFGISKNEVDDIAFWISIFGIVGARLYYVIFNWQFYSGDLTEIYKIWHGGISVYGGLIAGLVFVFIYARNKAYSVYQLLDLLAISLPLAQALGRFGNFFNQEAFGRPTSLPWKMYIDQFNRPQGYEAYSYFHPTFLYEALWNLAVFFVLKKFLGKSKPGTLVFLYVGLYSLGRFFIEGLRLDSSFVFGVRIDQVVAVLGIIAAALGMFLRYREPKPKT